MYNKGNATYGSCGLGAVWYLKKRVVQGGVEGLTRSSELLDAELSEDLLQILVRHLDSQNQ